MRYQDSLDLEALKQYVVSMNHRAKSLGVVGLLGVEALQDRIFACAGQCEWCGKRIVNEDFEIDHILSLANGGQNSADNLAVACVACNRSKSAKHPAKFAAEIAARSTHRTDLVQTILEQHEIPVVGQKNLFEKIEPVSRVVYSEKPQPYNWSQDKTNQSHDRS